MGPRKKTFLSSLNEVSGTMGILLGIASSAGASLIWFTRNVPTIPDVDEKIVKMSDAVKADAHSYADAVGLKMEAKIEAQGSDIKGIAANQASMNQQLNTIQNMLMQSDLIRKGR